MVDKKSLPHMKEQYLQHALKVLDSKLTQKLCAGNQQVGCPSRLNARELTVGVKAAGSSHRWYAHTNTSIKNKNAEN